MGGARNGGRALRAVAVADEMNGAARWAVGLLVPASLAAVACRPTPEDADSRTILRRVARDTWRQSAARIEGFGYAPVAAGSRLEHVPSRTALLEEYLRIRGRVLEGGGRQDLRDLGIAALLLGDADSAVELLTRASDGSWSPGVAVDLAAALLARSERQSSPSRAAAAFEILAGLPQTPEVVFNRALALEFLGFDSEARRTWGAYLAIDGRSRWAEEARERSSRSEEQAGGVAQTAESNELEALTSELPSWARAVLAHDDAGAMRHLGEAGETSRRHSATFRDDSLLELVRLAQAAPTRGGEALAEALLSLARSRTASAAGDIRACVGEMESSSESRRPASMVLEGLRQITVAGCLFQVNELAAAERAARDALAAASRSERYPLLRGQAAWTLGLILHARNSPAEAVDAYGTALGELERAGDQARAARVRILQADLYRYLGRVEDAWRALARAARDSERDPRSRVQALASLNELASRSGLPRLALRAARAELEAASQVTPGKPYLAEASRLEGKALRVLGDLAGAERALRASLAVTASIPDALARYRPEAEAAVELASLLEPGRREEAERLLATASRVEEGDLFLRIALTRAGIFARAGENGRAEKELRAAIGRTDVELRSMASVSERDDFVEVRAELYERLIELLAAEARAADALAAGELMRAGLFPEGRTRTASSRLTGNQVIYSFLPMENELLVWREDRESTRMARRIIGREPLSRLVSSATAAVLRGESEGAPAELARLLFGAFELTAGEELLIVPDPVLFSVPFAALPDPGSGGPLIAKHVVALTPARTLWRGGGPQPRPGAHCAVVIEGAAEGGALFPELARLPLVTGEADGVAALYSCSRRATSAAEARRRTGEGVAVVHFAGHAVVAGDRRGFLLFSAPGGVEAVGPAELREWPVKDAVVVLSACSAAEGRYSTTVGREGLAWALLAAGASSVIADQWPVGDSAALEFSISLHRRLAKGEPPARAVRAVQLELMARGEPASRWSGWRTYGFV